MSKTKAELIEENEELKKSLAKTSAKLGERILALSYDIDHLDDELEMTSNRLTVAEEYIRELLRK